MQQPPVTRVRRADRYERSPAPEPATEAGTQSAPAPRPQPMSRPAAASSAAPVPRRPAAAETGTRAAPRPQGTAAPRPRSGSSVHRTVAPGPTAPETIYRSARAGSRMLQSPTTEEDARRERDEERERKTGRVMKTAAIAAALLLLACVAASLLATGWLRQQREAREAAQQRIVDAHPMYYRDLIEEYAQRYGLQPAYVSAIILNESSFDTHAESDVGARGLMQLMPDTAEWIAHKLGLDSTYDVEQLWEAETNIRFGCWYLNYLATQFGGDPVTVTSAYHAGQGEIATWLTKKAYSSDGRTLDLATMPEGPTKVYAGRVTRDYGIYDALYFHTFNEDTAAAQES